MLILSIPAVQTKIGKYATDSINDSYKTNITIGKVGLQFNGDVELKEILIKDYKLDTLISIKELNTSIISINNLYNGKLTFGDIDIEDLVFNLKTYKDAEDTNLDFFVDKFEDDNPRESPSSFLLSSSDVTFKNSVFKLTDENKETQKILDFDNLNVNATNFVIKGPDVKMRINKFAFIDSRGVAVKNLAANFEYTRKHMLFDQLSIKTDASELNGNLAFNYQREDLKEFTDKVLIDANFKNSEIDLSELNVFYNEFGTNQKAFLSNVNLSGTLNNLRANNLRLNTSRSTRIDGDLVFKNVFSSSSGKFSLDSHYLNLSSNYSDLVALLPNVLGRSIPSVFQKVGNFKIEGNSLITEESIDADLDINSDLGYVKSNLKLTNIDNIENANYEGNIILDDFNIGILLNDPLVENTSLNLDVKGKSFKLEDLETNLKGQIAFVDYNQYRYTNIDVSGDFGKNVFNGILKARDPNISIDFNGLADMSNAIRKFDFKANVLYANLRALNFVTRDSISEFRGFVDLAITGSTIDDFEGKVDVNKTTYKNQDQLYQFKDFSVTSSFINQERTVKINSPDIIRGQAKGKFKTAQVLKLIENSVGSIYTNYQPHQVEDGQYLDFNFTIYNQIASIFDKNLNLGSNTKVRGRIETDEKGFELKFSSPKISFNDNIANTINIQIDNKNPVFNTFVEIKDLNSSVYTISDLSLINVTKRDTLFIKTEFKGGKNAADNYDINLFYTINQNNQSIAGFRKSEFKFKGFDWLINSKKDTLNKVTFDRSLSKFKIDDILINQGGEQMLLSGVLNGETYKDIKLEFNNVQLEKITPRIDSLKLGGRVNGELALRQNGDVYIPKSDLNIREFEVNNYHLGNLQAIANGDNSITKYNIDLKLLNDSVESLSAIGVVDVNENNPNINVNVNFEDFLLDPLSPLGEGVISSIRGYVSGNANVSGSLKKPDINGELLLDKAGLGIPYLNVDYGFALDSRVSLKQQQFIFNNVSMTDTKYKSQGALNGYIEHNNFSDWQLNLDLTTNRLLVLDTEESEELYYGTAYVSGEANIKGFTDNLNIYVEGSTEQGTVFNIPLSDAESFGDNTYIKFLSPEEKKAKSIGNGLSETEIKGLNIEFNLDVNQNAEIEIVIDKNSGSTIKGRGDGLLGIFINTNGKFDMYGDFVVNQGIYKFKYGAIVEKLFNVEQGGNIVWNGSPLDADINLKALYTTTANPSVLLDAPINRSIPVNLEINLTGRLEQPVPDFTFNFPNVESTIKAELDYRLSSKEDRDNQGLFLLATGGFSGGALNVNGTISERLSSILNNILGSDNDNFQIGVDLDLAQNNPNFETESRVGLTLQTKLSDKVIINGKVGVPFGSAAQTTIAGDVQIDWLLNDEGTLKATVFNRENPIRNFGDDIGGFTQGLGLSYNVEFDTFKEFFQTLLKGKKKKKEDKPKEIQPQDIEEKLQPDFMSIKEKKSKKR